MTGCWSAGIFRPLDHLVPVGPRTMLIAGHDLFVAACGSITVRPGTPVPGYRHQCADCLVREMRKDMQ